MPENYKTYPSYIAMRENGMSDKEILAHIKISKSLMLTKVDPEILCCIVARSLGIPVAKPTIKSKFISRATSIQISEIDSILDNVYVDIKGRILNAYSDKYKVSFNITDMKKVLRCTLFNSSVQQFKNKKFTVGDLIKLKSIKVISYNKKKELQGNEFTTILKLKNMKSIDGARDTKLKGKVNSQ